MRATTLIELANRQGTRFPATNPTELHRYDSLDGFLKVFWLVQSTLAIRDDWARLAYESVIDGAAHGLIHRESFFTPTRHLEASSCCELSGLVGLITPRSSTPSDWGLVFVEGSLMAAAVPLRGTIFG